MLELSLSTVWFDALKITCIAYFNINYSFTKILSTFFECIWKWFWKVSSIFIYIYSCFKNHGKVNSHFAMYKNNIEHGV